MRAGRFPFAAIALLIAALLSACGGDHLPAPPASPAVWQVRGPNGQTGWLFGTIHALPDGYDWRTAAIRQALDRSGVLVVEVAELNDPSAVQRAFAIAAYSPALPPLPDRVAAADRTALLQVIDRAGMTVGDFDKVESWAAALMLANALRAGKAANGVDRALLAEGRPVIALEGAVAQFSIFDGLAEADQRALLSALIAEAANDNERALADAWMRGDMERLEQEDGRGLLADPELRAALLTDRNRAWAGKIAPLIDKGRRPFVAVGAAHMAGPDGLPALLAARGYAVQRLP